VSRRSLLSDLIPCIGIENRLKKKKKKLLFFHNLHSLSDLIVTMTTNNNTNYQLLKLYVDTIPNYNGDPNTLEIFINACENLFTNFGNNQDLQSYLIRAIISKLTDRALILIGTKTELKNWPLVKNALRLSFGDQRNLDCLEQDLITSCPFRNEHPLDFGKRVQLIRSRLAAKLNTLTEIEMPSITKAVYMKQYDQLAQKTFIRGLPGNLQSIVRLRNPTSIEHAMSIVTEEENFRYTQNFSNLLNTNQKPTNNRIPIKKPSYQPFNSSFTPNYNTNHSNSHNPFRYYPSQTPSNTHSPPFTYNQQQPTNFNSQTHFKPQQPQFPSQPISLRPKTTQQKFFTNSQVFKTPRNVFKPTGQKTFDPVEPMSTTSRNPTARYPLFNQFRPSGQNNFISEELHNIEDDRQVQQSPYSSEINETNNDESPNNYLQYYQNNLDLGNHPEYTGHEENIDIENQQNSEPPYHYEQQTYEEQNFPNASPFYHIT
jgi:hypothetical protein